VGLGKRSRSRRLRSGALRLTLGRGAWASSNLGADLVCSLSVLGSRAKVVVSDVAVAPLHALVREIEAAGAGSG
jgi:hypothetical protein